MQQHKIKQTWRRLAMPAALAGLLVLVGALCAYPALSVGTDVHATGTTGTGVSIALDKSTLNLSSSAADSNGFVSSSVVSSVTSIGGYHLYMSTMGVDGADAYTSALVNSGNKQYTISTLPGSGDGSTIDLNFTTADSTRTYANTSNFTNNKWAYSVADITSGAPTSGTSTFKAVPLDQTVVSANSSDATTANAALDTLNNETAGGLPTTRVSSIHSSDDATGASHDGTSPDNIEVTIATRTDNTIPAGDYTNTLVFTAIGIDYNNTLTYDPNGELGNGTSTGADGTTTVGGDMSMVAHINLTSDSNIMLYAPNYWRKGYGFAGWSAKADATKYLPYDASITLGTGEAFIYGPSESITISNDSILNSNLATGATLYAIWVPSAGNLQGWEGCSSLAMGDMTALTDTRDGNTYAVGKLKDGKCWTSENLRLASGTVDASTTNNPVENFAWTESSNELCTEQSSACFDKVLINTNNINSNLAASPSINNTSSSWYGYGVNYNWYASTGGRGTYSTAGGNAEGDICPANWHLPTGNTDGEYQALYNAIGTTPANIRKYPNNFTVSGGWYGSSADFRRSYGLYWSSTAYSNSHAYDFNFNSGSATSSDHSNKGRGHTVRCIAEQKLNVNVTVGSNLFGTATGTGEYKAGDTVTLGGLTANTGHHLEWKVVSGGVTLSSATATNPSFTIGSEDVEISVSGVANTYTIVYNKNGGTGTMQNSDPFAYSTTATVTLDSNAYTRTNYTFLGWALSSGATAAKYTNAQTITASTIASDAGVVAQNNGTINLWAVWAQNAAANTIVYNCNGADGGDMSAATHTNIANGASVTLIPANCWRSGYGNAGWNTSPDGTGTNYGPNESITAPSNISSVGLTLYAHWIKSAGNMQDWKGCSSLATGAVTALTDTRDNNTYAVAKLADGKCWWIENLRLSSGTINSSNTHNPISGFAWTASTNSWCVGTSSTCYDQVLINTNNINSNLTASPATNNDSSSWYAYGTYYNYYTASTGRGASSVTSGNVAGDVCPLGWRMPTSTSSGEFYNMYTAIGKTPANVRKYPNNFVLSGYWSGSSAYVRNSHGLYWSATVNGTSAYRLFFANNDVNPSRGDYGKYVGVSVRCIAG